VVYSPCMHKNLSSCTALHCTALHLLAIPVPHTTIGARSASHAVTRCLTPTHAWLVLQYSDLHSNYFCTTISFGTHANEPRQLLRHPLQILHRYGFPPTFVRAPPAKSGSGVPASTFLFPLVLAAIIFLLQHVTLPSRTTFCTVLS
jgi:hypothetical protein